MFWIFIIVLLAFFLMLSFNRVYCYFFEHEEWNEWKKYIKDVDKFEYCESLPNGHKFIIPNTNIEAYVWDDEGCSIHDKTDCVCCSFDEYHSNKMKKLLMDKIEKNKIMLDYEKKYNGVLEKAKGIINYYKEHNRCDEAAIEDLEEIFPELKESGDEQNAILQELKALHLRMERQTVCNDAGGNRMWRKVWQHINEVINIIKEDKEAYKW